MIVRPEHPGHVPSATTDSAIDEIEPELPFKSDTEGLFLQIHLLCLSVCSSTAFPHF